MCLQTSLVTGWQDWNWDGDEIVFKPIIPASRTIPDTKKSYHIDIREFLTTTDNAVISEELGEIINALPDYSSKSYFRSHSKGSFDFRADAILRYMGKLKHKQKKDRNPSHRDAWLFPDETLAQGYGDCEDLAFVLAALLLAAGISRYCVRVALGRVVITPAKGRTEVHDHCWVMYQNESASWEIFEPMSLVEARVTRSGMRGIQRQVRTVEYIPHYVFNSDHLWKIHSRHLGKDQMFMEYCASRTFWNDFDPSFALSVHNSIFDEALKGKIPDSALSAVKRKSLMLDANIATYDPRDHFDNGYIDLGWKLVNDRLAEFKKDNNKWDSFGAAAHSIGDFYAHSSYVHFAKLQNPTADKGSALIYAPDVDYASPPQYDGNSADPSVPPFDLNSADFSMNPYLWKGTKQQGAEEWHGDLISGRYAQKYDPRATFIEGFTSIPYKLTQASDFNTRGALPHHNEIAVDDKDMGKKHKLYSQNSTGPEDRHAYANQFKWRKNTAMQHIQKALMDNLNP